MPVSPTYPGVYVQEVPSGVRTISGVSTSIGMFLGTSKKGPIGDPIRCLSYTSFKNTFGEDSNAGGLAQYVRLFFLNGGTDCYVLRMAKDAKKASVTLCNENNKSVLKLEAKDGGVDGENIRAVVSYSASQPEQTFNLEIYRMDLDSAGNRVKTMTEMWRGLTLDPNSPYYAKNFVSQNSALVNIMAGADLASLVAGSGFSISGLQMNTGPGSAAAQVGLLKTQLSGLLTSTPAQKRLKISVDGSSFIEVALTQTILKVATNTAIETDIATAIETDINDGFVSAGLPTIKVKASFLHFTSSSTDILLRLQIRSAATIGDIIILPASTEDISVPLMLGTAQGGIEVSGRAHFRPAANGIILEGFDPTNDLSTGPGLTALDKIADLDQSSLVDLTLDTFPTGSVPPSFTVPFAASFPAPNSVTPPTVITVAGAKVRKDASGGNDGVREKLQIMAQRINAFIPAVGQSKWRAEVWGYRLALLTLIPSDNFFPVNFASNGFPTGKFIQNVETYSVGASGNNIGKQISASVPATDGTPPGVQEYRDAFLVPGGCIDKEVDLFNLMVLAPDSSMPIEKIYGDASVFCQQKRAFLLMDPPTELGKIWNNAQLASTGVAAQRIGLVKDYSAVFYPRVTVNDNGLNKNIGPAGAIAGLCARTDGTRGVWKAPAGIDADLRGIIGLEQKFSDGENGILNPRAINTLRIFPSGIVNWGARTNYGDDDTPHDYKYVPVRRLALFMEESLYRGLKWAVFEPNDEPLWSQIRLNTGAFMHDLFRKGAFQGAKPSDAYFVKCDSETTTQNDINLGIVNVWVGFAPLKPAEFVILYLQQKAGSIQA